ncbi:MAG TPA: hypothetical protein VNF48_07485 [Gammaproteobacteria bacterium]|nr:hypothetical protein [Gammaproteobacteria bacterium]
MESLPVTERIFIAGMYKLSTSRLLRVLDAHPGVKGVKEIGLLSAGAGEPDRGDPLLPVKERLFGYFGNNAWGAMPTDLTDDAEAAAILKSPWLRQAGHGYFRPARRAGRGRRHRTRSAGG